jgi:hypothetical protein
VTHSAHSQIGLSATIVIAILGIFSNRFNGQLPYVVAMIEAWTASSPTGLGLNHLRLVMGTSMGVLPETNQTVGHGSPTKAVLWKRDRVRFMQKIEIR